MTDLLLETSLTADQEDYVASARVCAENLDGTAEHHAGVFSSCGRTLLLDEYEFGLAEVLQFAVTGRPSSQKNSSASPFCWAFADFRGLQ